MKKYIFLLFVFFSSLTSVGQDVEQIIRLHTEAVGGAENWDKIKNAVISGEFTLQGEKVQVTRTVVTGKALRVDIQMNDTKGFQILTTREGWNYMPFIGHTKPMPMSKEEVMTSQDQLYLYDDFIFYKNQKKKIEFVGNEIVDGKSCYKLKVTNSSGQEFFIWVNNKDNLIVKKSVILQLENGLNAESITTYADYRKLNEGIVMPFVITADMQVTQIKSVTLNGSVSDAVFTPTE